VVAEDPALDVVSLTVLFEDVRTANVLKGARSWFKPLIIRARQRRQRLEPSNTFKRADCYTGV
jgi:hypothetical protein